MTSRPTHEMNTIISALRAIEYLGAESEFEDPARQFAALATLLADRLEQVLGALTDGALPPAAED